MATRPAEKLHAIVLRTVKYNDRHNILWLYTLEYGRTNVLVAAGSGRNAAAGRALTQPMSEIELMMRSGRGGLPTASDIRPASVSHSLHTDPAKMTIAMFLAEFLSVVLTEGESDSRTYGFVSRAVCELESSSRSIANFYIAFLLGLAAPLGISPDLNDYRPGRIFDMTDATFRDSIPMHTPHWLSADESAVLARLSRMTFENCHRFRFSRQGRSRVLDGLLRYYTIHYRSLANLRTLPVLREIYD